MRFQDYMIACVGGITSTMPFCSFGPETP
jgi:hypothetical protein